MIYYNSLSFIYRILWKRQLIQKLLIEWELHGYVIRKNKGGNPSSVKTMEILWKFYFWHSESLYKVVCKFVYEARNKTKTLALNSLFTQVTRS